MLVGAHSLIYIVSGFFNGKMKITRFLAHNVAFRADFVNPHDPFHLLRRHEKPTSMPSRSFGDRLVDSVIAPLSLSQCSQNTETQDAGTEDES